MKVTILVLWKASKLNGLKRYKNVKEILGSRIGRVVQIGQLNLFRFYYVAVVQETRWNTGNIKTKNCRDFHSVKVAGTWNSAIHKFNKTICSTPKHGENITITTNHIQEIVRKQMHVIGSRNWKIKEHYLHTSWNAVKRHFSLSMRPIYRGLQQILKVLLCQ